jgi:Rod binding domain-containing protein
MMPANELLQSIGRPPAAAAGVQPALGDRHIENLRETAEEFESIYQALTHGLGSAGPLGESDGDAFADMLQQEYGRLVSRSGGIGIADAVMREMLRMQEMEA